MSNQGQNLGFKDMEDNGAPDANQFAMPNAKGPGAPPTIAPEHRTYGTFNELFGAPGETPPAAPSIVGGAADFGAAAWADWNRKGDGTSTPALDHYFQSTPAGQMLKRFGQDVTAPISQLPSLSTIDDGKGVDFLKRTGDYDQWQKNHAATSDYFRNASMRPSAVSAVGEAQAMGRVLNWSANALSDLAKDWGSGIWDTTKQVRNDLAGERDNLNALPKEDFDAGFMAHVHATLTNLGGDFRDQARNLLPGTAMLPIPGAGPLLAPGAMRGAVGQLGAVGLDALGTIGSIFDIPQLIGKTNTWMATQYVNVHPVPGETPAAKQLRIQNESDKLSFYEMFMLGPEVDLGTHLNIMRRLDQASRAGVIGKPPVFTDTAMDIRASQQRAQAQTKAAGQEPAVERAAGIPAPDLQATPPIEAGPPAAETPARDVHGVAREMAPDLFAQYDPLAARHAWYTNWINELREGRDNDPRLQRAQEEIDQIMAKVGGVEDRLTNRQRDQIADIRGGMQDFLAVDTPDMVTVKKAMLENYQQMAELQPEVQAAYRAAAERMGAEAEARGEQSPIQTAPAPAPEPDVVAARVIPAAQAERPVAEPTGELTTPLGAVPQPPQTPLTRPELPAETAHIQTTQDIATDVSRQLQAAGRSKEEGDTVGQLIASHYDARARRLGGAVGTGADLYRLEGPIIQGAPRASVRGQRTFGQRARATIQDITKNVPGLRQILPDLSDTERTELTKQAATNLVDIFGKLPKAQEIASVAYAGRAKRGWYRKAAQAIHQLFGPADADRFTALLAAMSPQTSVESNLANALRTWVEWHKAGRPTDPAAIKEIMGRSVEGQGTEASVLEAWVNNSIRALTHEDPAKMTISGPKVNSFMQNLRGYVDDVTNDSWMATYAALDPEEFAATRRPNVIDKLGKTFGFKSPGYMAMSAVVRRAAKILTERTGETWTPSEVQETVWSWAKALYERRDRAGEDRTVQQILKAADLTHEDVAGASDFTSLLIRGVYSKILEEGGYGDELESIRRAAANAEPERTGPAVSVTGAEGSGLTQSAFERHLQQAGARLERVRAGRLEEQGVSPRDLAKKARNAEIQANLSATTPSIPGIQKLADAANQGDVAAGHLVNLIAHDSLTRLMSGIDGVTLQTQSNGGLYGGALEPSLGVTVNFPEAKRGQVLAALGKFAENFNQEQIHVRQPTIDTAGRVNTDGSYATPVYRVELKTPLTREELQHHIDQSGLYGITAGDDAVETYYVGNPRDKAAIGEFEANVQKLIASLGENAGKVESGTDRLWAYGRGEGATAGYDAIKGELPPGKEQLTQVPRALAERELGREVTPAEQAKEITPEQRRLQERIAADYETLPDNDLENPLVARAYDALTKAIDKQYASLPIKVEAWADKDANGNWVSRGGEPYRNSAAMRNDVLHNNHLWFFITDKDQFGPPGSDFTGHPLLRPAGTVATNGYPMLQNDVLRVVHDYYAHLTSPVSFGPKGEEAAWRNHMATMDDPWARWALTSETRGQNSWVNFGAHVAPESGLSERPFARQKAALLPIGDTLTGDDYVDLPMLELQRDLTPRQAEGSLKDTMFQSGAQQPVFYSQLTRLIEDLPQAKAPAREWLNIIDNLRQRGVKQEEIDWSGVKEWLGEQHGPVAKQALLDKLAENKVELQEVHRGPHVTVPDWKLWERATVLARNDGRDLTTMSPAQRGPYLTKARDEFQGKETKFEDYTLPGGQNYREMLLTMPKPDWMYGGRRDAPSAAAEAKVYRSPHWEEPNVLAHIRFDDRTGPDGEKVLHIAEVQSDWHQAGRKRGYNSDYINSLRIEQDAGGIWRVREPNGQRVDLDGQSGFASEGRARTAILVHARKEGGVPNAPFKSSWHELAMKRALRYAVENGYDRISWDTGETNAARYDLRKQVKQILVEKYSDDQYHVKAYDHRDNKIVNKIVESPQAMADLIGKDAADKVMEQINASKSGIPRADLQGLDLEIGGEGMKGFYDRILPQFMSKYVKKWGGKVEPSSISFEKRGDAPPGLRGPAWKQEYETIPTHSVEITPQMRDSVMQGQPLFQPNRGAITFRKGIAPIIRLAQNADASTFLHESGHAWLEELMRDAKHEAAPAQLLADAETTRAWLGIKDGEPIPRAAHEKWARGFERYLMEGIAPTKELAGVFARFKQWLTKIYQTVTRLRSPINDDIRQVFDRLVATPDQPTIIAEPRNTARMMADMHEVEAGTTPAHMAGAAADQIDHEVETQLRRVAPEEHDALLRSELEGGAVQKAGGAPEGRVHEAKPLAGPTSGNAATGALAAGEHELAPAGSQLRATAIKTGAGNGPAAGGGGAAPESIEERIARRLAGGSERQGQRAGGGLETPGTGPQVESQLGLNTQARAIAAGMPDETVGPVLQHAQLSKTEQADLAQHLLSTDPMTARDIAMGKRPAPKGLMSIFVYRAVEAQAIRDHDWVTINALAQSKLLDDVTDAGRTLNALADQDKASPTYLMRSVIKAKEKAVTLGQRGINPQLTPAQQQMIVNATDEVRNARDDLLAHGNDPADEARRDRLGRAIINANQVAENMKPKPAAFSWSTFQNWWNLPKSTETSIVHFSGPFVQARGLITTPQWWKGFPEMFSYFMSEDAYIHNQAMIITHPDYPLLEQGNISLGGLGTKLSEREEQIQSTLVQQASHWLSNVAIPGTNIHLPDAIHAFSRAFVGYLQYVRANAFYDLIAAARARGEDLGPDSRFVRDIGNIINDFTGRGNIGVNDQRANIIPVANTVFYTTRKISATMNMFNPERYLNPNISVTARRAAFRNLMGHIATTAAFIGLARALGNDISLDPDDSNFLLPTFNGVPIDLSGGSITYLRMWARMGKWAWQHYVTGENQKSGARTALEDVWQYLRGQLAPTTGFVADALYGKDPANRPFNITDELSDKMMPIFIGEVIDAVMSEADNAAAWALMPLGVIGVRLKFPLPPKEKMGLNVWGGPIGHFSKPLNEPIDQELKNVGYNMGFPGPAIKGVQLSKLQYQEYIQVSGEKSRENIENDMSLPGWAEYPKEEKLRIIRSDVAAARRDAADQLMSEDLTTAAPGDSIMDKATRIQNKQYGIDQ